MIQGKADMDAHQPDDGSPETPESILDALRDRRDWTDDQRDRQLTRLVERFPADRVREAVRHRLRQIGGSDGDAILRLVEGYASPALLEELALALEDQPDLAPERAWKRWRSWKGRGCWKLIPPWWNGGMRSRKRSRPTML